MISARALYGILSRHGFEVTLASTIAQALDHLQIAQPDYVLLDLMLPDGNGAAVLRHMRDMDHAARVVVTTAVSDPERLREVRDLKPDAVLHKPLDVNLLLMMIGPTN